MMNLSGKDTPGRRDAGGAGPRRPAPQHRPRRLLPWLPALLALALLGGVCLPERAGGFEASVEHHLEVELLPDAHLLAGRDRMKIRTDDRRKLVFALSDKVAQLQVEVDGGPRTFRFSNAELEVPLEPDERHRALEVVVAYQASFNDPLPLSPLNTDNPGFGVTASITPTGTFLLAGAAWYPDLINARDTFPRLRVKAPEGVLAVTAGQSLGHTTRDGATWSEWRIDNPLRGLALSAAAYEVQERKVGDIVAAAYLLPANRDLAAAYLDAIASYLELYTGLFGPYPFPKFAVVENFFPTGYGFPSYTLLGSTVLRLPFILKTSLGHEIAHCWWGSGVFVDYAQGNWSEGLTTYVSDYLYAERESAAAARDYRIQALRNLTTLVPPAKDIPLARFTSRVDPATKAVGYDKAMMVFHMLRREIGEEAFWGALRDLYRERLFQPTAWDDLRRAFENRAGRSLEPFFAQWVNRKGAPRLHLADVRRERAADGWTVAGRLVQEKPVFQAAYEVAVAGGGPLQVRRVELAGESTEFALPSETEPHELVVDPEIHVLRRLDPAEIPPTVNALRSSPSTLLVVGETAGPAGARAAETLAEALGLRNYAVVAESGMESDRFAGQDVVLIGAPRAAAWLRTMPDGGRGQAPAALSEAAPGEVVFAVTANPYDPARVLALLAPGGSPEAASAAARIPHYGRFSYLLFRDGRNVERRTWEPEGSPVKVRWK